MRGVGDDDGRAVLANRLQVGLDDEDAGQFALGAREGGERGVVHAGDLGEDALESVHDGEDALRLVIGLHRVGFGEAGHGGDGVVDLGVELHRARAQGVHLGVDGVVELGETGVVADDVELGDLGEVEALAEEFFRDVGG